MLCWNYHSAINLHPQYVHGNIFWGKKRTSACDFAMWLQITCTWISINTLIYMLNLSVQTVSLQLAVSRAVLVQQCGNLGIFHLFQLWVQKPEMPTTLNWPLSWPLPFPGQSPPEIHQHTLILLMGMTYALILCAALLLIVSWAMVIGSKFQGHRWIPLIEFYNCGKFPLSSGFHGKTGSISNFVEVHFCEFLEVFS